MGDYLPRAFAWESSPPFLNLKIKFELIKSILKLLTIYKIQGFPDVM